MFEMPIVDLSSLLFFWKCEVNYNKVKSYSFAGHRFLISVVLPSAEAKYLQFSIGI
jgi:hypothetical protein